MIKFFKLFNKSAGDRFGDNMRLERTMEGTVMEVATLFLVIGLWTAAVYMFRNAPETIPTHFDVNGIANNEGSRLTLLLLAAVGTLVSGLMLAGAYAPKKMVNMPVKVTHMRQLVIMSRMLRVMAILMVLLFISIVFMIGYPEAPQPRIIMMVIVGLFMVVPVGFTIAARNKK